MPNTTVVQEQRPDKKEEGVFEGRSVFEGLDRGLHTQAWRLSSSSLRPLSSNCVRSVRFDLLQVLNAGGGLQPTTPMGGLTPPTYSVSSASHQARDSREDPPGLAQRPGCHGRPRSVMPRKVSARRPRRRKSLASFAGSAIVAGWHLCSGGQL